MNDDRRPALTDEARGAWLLRCSYDLLHRERVGSAVEAVPTRLLRQLVVRDHYANELERALVVAIDALDRMLAAGAADAWSSDEPQMTQAREAMQEGRRALGRSSAWDEHDRGRS